jgi:mRNA interferase RelE/StbE
MQYTIKLHKNVDKFLLSHPDVKKRFLEKAYVLSFDPLNGALDIKKMQWLRDDLYRLRVWKYRFIYEIIEHELVVYFVVADSRGGVY